MRTVFLVRHANIDLPPANNDPDLNAAGRQRADALANALGAAGVGRIFTSERRRTKQTVAPLASGLHIQPSVAPAPAVFAQKVSSGSFGDVILVAGHSNTMPEMIAALGVAGPAAAIGESEFDNLFIVTIANGQASVLRLKY
jgi:phosphohistidine phosphatase SixA